MRQRCIALISIAGLMGWGCGTSQPPAPAGSLPGQPTGTAASPASTGAGMGMTGAAPSAPNASATNGAVGDAPVPAGSPTAGSGAPMTGSPVGSAPVAPEGPPPYAWTNFNFDYDNSRNNRFETTLTTANVSMLKEKWSFDMMLGGVTSTPIVVDGQVFVTDHGRQNRDSPDNIPGAMYAFEAQTGTLQWKKEMVFPIRASTPLVVGETVYAGGGWTIYAWNRRDGTQIWATEIHEGEMYPMIDSSPQRIRDKIIVGLASYDVIYAKSDYIGRGAIVALNATDGSEAWRIWTSDNNAMSGAGVSVWSSLAYDVERDLAFIGTGQSYEAPPGKFTDAVVAFKPDDGAIAWIHQYHPSDVYTDGRGGSDWDIGASPNLFKAQGKDVVGVGSKGGVYKALDRETGEPVWTRMVGPGSALGGMMSVGAYADGVIFVSNTGGGGATTHALDAETGMSIWTRAMPAATWGALTHANGVLYHPCRNGRLYALDAKSGMTLWEGDLLHDAAGGVSVSEGVVYAGSGFTGLGNSARPGVRLTAFSLDGAGSTTPTGGGGSGITGGPDDPCPQACELLERRCGGGGCHAAAGPVAMLDVESPGLAARLTNASAVTSACQGSILLDPASPEQSLLYGKLIDPPRCGVAMPPGSPLAQDEIGCVLRWIKRPDDCL
jgi:polyvinyl alcohol dehydrogenase (cytochrome)